MCVHYVFYSPQAGGIPSQKAVGIPSQTGPENRLSQTAGGISQTAGENSISSNRRNKYHSKQRTNTISTGPKNRFSQTAGEISQTAEENSISSSRRKYRIRTAGE